MRLGLGTWERLVPVTPEVPPRTEKGSLFTWGKGDEALTIAVAGSVVETFREERRPERCGLLTA